MRCGSDLLDERFDLIHAGAVRHRPVAPLVAVNRPQIARCGCPFIPDGYLMTMQALDVGVAGQKPQQFVNDRLEVYPFGGDQGKALTQIKAHLIAEDAQCADTGAVLLGVPVATDMGE